MSDQPDSSTHPDDSGRASDGGPYNPPPPLPLGDQLAELAVQVTRLRRNSDASSRLASERHDELSRAIGDARAEARRGTEDLVAALRRETEDHFAEAGATLREHATAIERVLARQQRTAPTPPVPWHSLTATQAAREWERLAQWIDQVFVPWGEITRSELPDCWALHRPVLVQLSWLHTIHVQAYRPDADPGAAAEWHVRWAPAVLRKIQAAINAELCRPGEHMIPQEESNRRRAAAMASQPPQTRRPGAPLATLGTERLATREFWDAFYNQARDADLRWRTTREEHDSGGPQGPAGDAAGNATDQPRYS